MTEQPPEPTAEDCIRAGMYWFGRSDFVAAEAWWRRAVELDPQSTRAQECLRLLEKTSSTGFKESEGNPFLAPSAKRNPTIPPETPVELEPEPVDGSMDLDPASFEASEAPTPAEGLQAPFLPNRNTPSDLGLSTDPFDFAEQGQQLYRTASQIDSPAPTPNPWDQGPSRTSVVNVDPESLYDAVPDPTPLPQLDRERFFNRGDPESREEIVDFLRATGDLPAGIDPDFVAGPSAINEIVFDDPIEIEDPEPSPVSHAPIVESPPPPTDPVVLLESARARFQLHDFTGALELVEQIPPGGYGAEEAKNLAAESRANLLKMYESKIGDFERTPRVLISGEEVIWLNLNHRAGFILSQIDGAVTYEDLISLSGMPRLDTVRILAALLQDKVIG